MKVIGTDKNGHEIAEVSVSELDAMFKEIRNKAIDDFISKIKDVCANRSVYTDRYNNELIYAHEDGTWHSLIDDVLEPLKVGGVE